MEIEVTLKEKTGSMRTSKHTYNLIDLLNNDMWSKERWEAIEVKITDKKQ